MFFFILVLLNLLEFWYFSEIIVILFVLFIIVCQLELKKKLCSICIIIDYVWLVEIKVLVIECICNYNNFIMFIDDIKKVFIY